MTPPLLPLIRAKSITPNCSSSDSLTLLRLLLTVGDQQPYHGLIVKSSKTEAKIWTEEGRDDVCVG